MTDMKIALIGYGKMGKMIEQIALDRGHEIVSIIDVNNQEDIGVDFVSSGALTHSAPILDLSMKHLHPVEEAAQ